MSIKTRLIKVTDRVQEKKPSWLSGIPTNSLLIIALLVVINLAIWAVLAIPLSSHHALLAPAALSYTLGLRHALDADHISAIDLTTRRLIAAGQRPATVGTFFSLGHSTIVVVTCIVVAATSGALEKRFDGFRNVGGIIGTSISAGFLIVLCIANGWVLYTLVRRLRQLLKERRSGLGSGNNGGEVPDMLALNGPGVITRLAKGLFKAIDRPWKMYPLGVVFGLGFDTSSEIAILGIASLQALKGTSMWLILIFPILFTSGMCLIDTIDGALMMALYTSEAFSQDEILILYYSITLTAITVTISAFIGIVQVLSLVQNVANPVGKFWDGVEAIGDHFDVIGGAVCGLFLVIGLASVVAYKPWRRYIEGRHYRRGDGVDEEERRSQSPYGTHGPSLAGPSDPAIEYTSIQVISKGQKK